MMKNSRRLDIKFALLAWVFCFCSANTETDEDLCVDSLPPIVELPDELGGETVLYASLSADERIVENEDGDIETRGMLSAYFADLSDYEEEDIPAIPFGDACVGELGDHVINTKPKALDAGEVVFRGLVTEDTVLEEEDVGRFLGLFDRSIFTREGGENVEVDVASLGSGSGFPGFQANVVTPPLVKLNDMNLLSDSSMEIDWEPADATYFEITMTATSVDSSLPSNRLICFLVDDGCHSISKEAIEWLLSQGTDEIKVRLKRHELMLMAVAKGVLVELDAMRSFEFRYTMD
ncbi:MAG: hypothetical protein GY847_37335 [Proteobacteria bacterium]|nr:hypothetical protein [Pseudomonadota bacterium]